MSRHRFLPAAALPQLVDRLAAAGTRVYGPSTVGGRSEYRRLADGSRLDLDAPMPALSLKALFLPPTEPILRWHRHHNDVALEAAEPRAEPTVVLGARPCDAAGVAVLDKVMGWDYRDDTWFARREATTIVAIACTSPGPDCFCEMVGLGPSSSKGADALLTRAEGGYTVESFTAKGAALFGGPDVSVEIGGTELGRTGVPPVAIGFDAPLWDRIALGCHGCGACAAVCPTCHCFDIVDEPDGLLDGTRRRNWDTCQSAIFTRHASGHNPRADQRSRFRQRVLHKFSIYPRRFGEVLCTGCGRCAAACPAGQNLREILAEVTR